MNIWLLAALTLTLGLMPLGAMVLLKPPIDRLLALNVAGTACSLVLLLFAAGLDQPSFCDLALAAAVLNLPAGLVFTHFMERSL